MPASASLLRLNKSREEHFDKQFNVNVKGLLFTVQKALPLLQPGGSIVLNASIVAIERQPGNECLQRDQSCGPIVCAHLVAWT